MRVDSVASGSYKSQSTIKYDDPSQGRSPSPHTRISPSPVTGEKVTH